VGLAAPASAADRATRLGRVSQLAVDAGGVQAASGKAEGSADTGVVSADPDNAAGRRLGAAGAARQLGDTP